MTSLKQETQGDQTFCPLKLLSRVFHGYMGFIQILILSPKQEPCIAMFMSSARKTQMFFSWTSEHPGFAGFSPKKAPLGIWLLFNPGFVHIWQLVHMPSCTTQFFHNRSQHSVPCFNCNKSKDLHSQATPVCLSCPHDNGLGLLTFRMTIT